MPEFYFMDTGWNGEDLAEAFEIYPSKVGVVSGNICHMSTLTCLAFFLKNNSFMWDIIYIAYPSPIKMYSSMDFSIFTELHNHHCN